MNRFYRHISFALLLCVSTMGVLAQEMGKQPKIKFEKKLEDVGTLSVGKGEKRTVTFVYANEGDAPLVLERAETSCGCTTVQLPKKAVKPGKKGKVKVTVDATYLDDRGVFGTLITLYYNSTLRYTRIRIKGVLEN